MDESVKVGNNILPTLKQKSEREKALKKKFKAVNKFEEM
jgi:hypothetical protein